MSVLLENKKAYFDFEIFDKYEAGISLSGAEVKSLRQKRGNLEGARVLIRGGEAYLLNMDIPPYQPKNQEGYDSSRTRRLLLQKEEILKLSSSETEKGLTIIPISIYNKGRFIKVSIALARHKKKADKRETIKRREMEREIRRTLKR
jgi:SsrA-binding protein